MPAGMTNASSMAAALDSQILDFVMCHGRHRSGASEKACTPATKLHTFLLVLGLSVLDLSLTFHLLAHQCTRCSSAAFT